MLNIDQIKELIPHRYPFLLVDRVLELEERPLCNLPIGDCVDTLCLEDACNNTITTFGEWMNAVTVKICETP